MATTISATILSAQRLTFGKLLKRYRRAAGMSQETLAERAGYSVGYISKLERGERLPIPTTAELLADALALRVPERGALQGALLDASQDALRRPVDLRPTTLTRHPTPSPSLVNREHELALLARHLSGHGPPVLLFSGEPGIGKTRLLEEAVELGERRGWCVLVGGCHRQCWHEHFSPLLGALETYIHNQQPAQLREDLQGCGWLARLLPELVDLAGVPMPAWELPSEQERRLMFVAVRRFLANISGPAGTLLVLDDLQWANADGTDLLSALLPGATNRPLRIVGAYRNMEVGAETAFGTMVGELAHDRLAKRATLGPLGPEAASALLDVLLTGVNPPPDEAGWRESVLQKAAGVPFYEVCFVEGLRAGTPGCTPSAEEVPWEIAESILGRLRALPACAQRSVHIAAVARYNVPRPLLLAVATRLGCGQADAVEGLDTAVRERLLFEDGDGGYAVAQSLVQDVVEGDLGGAQCAQIHLMLAEALEQGHTQFSTERLAEHYTRAGEVDRALTYLKEAGRRSEAVHAYADAALYYRELATRLEAADRTEEAAWAREHLGSMLTGMGQYKPALQELERARASYHRAGNYEGQGRAAASIGWVHASDGTPDEGIARLQRELLGTAQLSTHGTLAIYVALCRLFYLTGRYADQLDAAERGVALATAIRDRPLRASAQVERATALGLLGRTDTGLRVLEDQALPLARAAGDVWSLVLALHLASVAYRWGGKFDRGMRMAERALKVAERWDDPGMIAWALAERGLAAFYRGDWDVGRADTELAVTLIRESKAMWWTPNVLTQRAAICLATGLREEFSTRVAESIALAEPTGDLHALREAHGLLAECELLDGQPERALARLEALLDRPGQVESDVTRLLPLLAWSYLELDDLDQAGAIAETSAERATKTGLCLVPLSSMLVEALVAARQHRWQDAVRAADGALTLSRALHYPYAAAKAQYVYGLIFREQGKSEPAVKRLGAARDILARLGERLYSEHVERALAEVPAR